MNFQELKKVKQRLENGEIIKLTNGKDVAELNYSRLRYYNLILNGLPKVSLRTFRLFVDESIKVIDERNLVEEKSVKQPKEELALA